MKSNCFWINCKWAVTASHFVYSLVQQLIMPGICISAVLWQNPTVQSSMQQICTHVYSTVSIAPSFGVPPHFTKEPLYFCFPTHYSFNRTLKIIEKQIFNHLPSREMMPDRCTAVGHGDHYATNVNFTWLI